MAGLAARAVAAAGAVAALLVAAAASPAAALERHLVTYGSAVKLASTQHAFNLHSHEISYGSGSGQQSVTGTANEGDEEDLWMIKPVEGSSIESGEPLTHNSEFRLMHASSKKWLHSHNFQSPLSNQQEVSCHGDHDNSDANDVWRLVMDPNSKWKQESKVHIQHVATNAYLSMTSRRFGRPISGQLEVVGSRGHSVDSNWKATEGIYVPKPTPASEL